MKTCWIQIQDMRDWNGKFLFFLALKVKVNVTQSCLNLFFFFFFFMSDSLGSPGVYCLWNSPGQNTGVGSLSLLHGIFPTQESNQGLLHCRRILYQMNYEGSPFGSSFGLLLSFFLSDAGGQRVGTEVVLALPRHNFLSLRRVAFSLARGFPE